MSPAILLICKQELNYIRLQVKILLFQPFIYYIQVKSTLKLERILQNESAPSLRQVTNTHVSTGLMAPSQGSWASSFIKPLFKVNSE